MGKQFRHKLPHEEAAKFAETVATYDNLSSFKIYLANMVIFHRLIYLAPTASGEGNRLFTEFKGALFFQKRDGLDG